VRHISAYSNLVRFIAYPIAQKTAYLIDIIVIISHGTPHAIGHLIVTK